MDESRSLNLKIACLIMEQLKKVYYFVHITSYCIEKEAVWAFSNKEEKRNDSYFQQNNKPQPAENAMWIQWFVFNESMISRGLWPSCCTDTYVVIFIYGTICNQNLCRHSLLFGDFT